ncbi:cytochrome C [Pelobium manganitolerans]|uniref:Cytochrome C n=1 Tax=Pelobium manganitolerans TaxID=1842495 RepID=A0A419S342_9SPHI|nr:cytochrome c [Pelobium manganitolerans]RKD13697.1 cytochrome C [Pelobium manganitolerans]
MRKLKLLITIFSFSAGLAFISSCGGSGNGSQESADANTTETAAAEDDAAEVAVDPNAKSDSKGVGKFTNVEVDASVDEAMAAKGKAIFDTKCTACHKTTAEKLVGPGLKEITKLRTPEWIMNMITNPEEMTKKDPIAKALLEEHLIQMTFQNVSDEETRQIYEFLRSNDKD